MKKGGKVLRKGKPGDSNPFIAVDESCSMNEPPERDIGPTTSSHVILRDLNQMANDFTRAPISAELSRMRKLEHIYSITDSPEVEQSLRKVDDYKREIREKKNILEQVVTARAKILAEEERSSGGLLSITNGGGGDCFEGLNDQNVDFKLLEMEKRVIEAQKALHSRGTDANLQEALQKYHCVFKQSMDSIENIAKTRKKTINTKFGSLRQFIDDTEKTMLSDGKGDLLVSEAITELRRLNKYDTSSNKLPFIPGLPYNFDEDLAQLNLSYNDILDDMGVPEDIVEIPMSQFMDHALELKPAKSIMKKIEDKEKNRRTKHKLKKTAK